MDPAPELRLRPATVDDIPVIRTLADRIWRAAYRELLSPAQIDYMLGWMYSPATLARQMADGVRYELAESGGEPVGYLAARLHPDTRKVELHKLYLAPELHGRGLGRTMLSHALAQATAAGANHMELRVNRHNLRAQRAYLRAGFRVERELCEDIGGGFVMDDFVMVRALGRDGADGARRKRTRSLPLGVSPLHRYRAAMSQPLPLTLGHSPDPDDAFMFYGLAKGLIPTPGLRFEHILQDIQTLNERATRGELDISAISIHAYAHVSGTYALLPSGASMGDGYGPMLVAKEKFTREQVVARRIAVPGKMTSAFLALQLWLGKRAEEFDFVVVPFDEIFTAVKTGRADVGLIIHEGQLTYANEGLVVCEDLGAWWGRENDGLPLPLGGNVIHKRHAPELRRRVSGILTASIQFSLDHRPEAVAHSLPWARDMGHDLADKFVGMYVNHWTLDYGERGRESIRRFLTRGQALGVIPHAPALEFV